MTTELSLDIMKQIIPNMKYAKYLPSKLRRETLTEIIDRNKGMHSSKYPEYLDEISKAYEPVYDNIVLPSMRSMQFAGEAILHNPARIYNCAYHLMDKVDAFSELMFLLLGGTGVGYSVQYPHVNKLPAIIGHRKSRKTGKILNRRFLIQDSVEGWADAVKVLVESYFYGKSNPVFDFSAIRDKGTRLVTSGGKAPGPQPLKDCIHNIRKVLDGVTVGEYLKPIQVHDICCYIAGAVLSGGIRRSALICLFSKDDYDMLTSKSGEWWIDNPQRGRANNSAVFLRSRASKDDFDEFFKFVRSNGTGEPGIYWTNDINIGANPCVEIGLKPNQFCNLVEIDSSKIQSQQHLEHIVGCATIIATLQASYTDFHYLSDEWREVTESEALIGVSFTGIASGNLDGLDLEKAANIVKNVNEDWANKLGINPAARTTCVKPAGTTSLVFGTSSGIHAWHAPYYIRRITLNKDEPIYNYLNNKLPEILQDISSTEAKLCIPVKSPENALYREQESSIEFLNRVKTFYTKWVKPGHRNGPNTNNVSCTVNVKDNEWDDVQKWMWDNRYYYNGISTFPYWADSGELDSPAPFQQITEETYNKMVQHLNYIDITEIVEHEDNTNLSSEVACAGGSCEI